MSFSVYEPETSVLLRAYYYKKVLPDIKDAFKKLGEFMDLEQTDLFLREISPVCRQVKIDPSTGKKSVTLKEIINFDSFSGYIDSEETDNSELIEHIEYIKQYAAENLSIFIDDPKTILK